MGDMNEKLPCGSDLVLPLMIIIPSSRSALASSAPLRDLTESRVLRVLVSIGLNGISIGIQSEIVPTRQFKSPITITSSSDECSIDSHRRGSCASIGQVGVQYVPMNVKEGVHPMRATLSWPLIVRIVTGIEERMSRAVPPAGRPLAGFVAGAQWHLYPVGASIVSPVTHVSQR